MRFFPAGKPQKELVATPDLKPEAVTDLEIRRLVEVLFEEGRTLSVFDFRLPAQFGSHGSENSMFFGYVPLTGQG